MKAPALALNAAPYGRYASRYAPPARDEAPHTPRLTPRQLEVLAWLCEGLPNKLIARRLDISAATVKVHIASILRELGVASRLQAVIAARVHGLVGESAPSAAPQWAGYPAPRASVVLATARA